MTEDGAPKLVQERKRFLLGYLLLLCVVALWIIGSFIMNSMFTSMNYNKPFLITYLCTATFTLYLVRPAWKHLKARREFKLAGRVPKEINRPHQPVGSFTNDQGVIFIRPEYAYRNRSHSRSMSRSRSRPLSVVCTDPPLTTNQTAALALLFCGLWFVANWSMNAALGYTSVSSTTILSSMSGFFTLGVGSCVGVEEFTLTKMGSVILSILGVFVVSQGDRDILAAGKDSAKHMIGDDPHLPTAPLLGDALALGSALAYAFYVVLLKVRIRNETRVSMTLFFGFVGLFNILLIWPLGLVLHFTGVEIWEWPSGGKLWASIAINAAITFVSDALYLRAMLMTSPLAVTLGISLTIPLAMAGDIYRGTQLGGYKIYLGGALVLGSFLFNGYMDLKTVEEEIKAEDENEGGDEDQEGGISVRNAGLETVEEGEEARLLGVGLLDGDRIRSRENVGSVA